MNLNPIVRKVRNQLFNLSSPIQGGPYRRPQPSCWFCFAGSSPRVAAMQVAIHRRKLPAASCEGMDIWVVQNGDWFTKKWQKTTGFHGQAAKIVRISWLLLFWKATSTPLALEIERRFKCSPFGARGVWWFQNRKACCQRWNHQLFVYIYCFSSIYYMILCFLLSMHKYKPFLLDIQTGLLWVRKRQFVSPNTLHDLKLYWPLAVAVIHKLFLVEIELRMVNRPKPHKKKKNNVFGTTWI